MSNVSGNSWILMFRCYNVNSWRRISYNAKLMTCDY